MEELCACAPMQDLSCEVSSTTPTSETLQAAALPLVACRADGTEYPFKMVDGVKRYQKLCIIDGSNVAFRFGNDKFNAEGPWTVVAYWKKQGHDVLVVFKALDPGLYRRYTRPTKFDNERRRWDLLRKLEDDGLVKWARDRQFYDSDKESRSMKIYDDLYIIELAMKTGGFIVSQDNYKDVCKKYGKAYYDVVNNQLLKFHDFYAGNYYPLKDPMGELGASREEFVLFAAGVLPPAREFPVPTPEELLAEAKAKKAAESPSTRRSDKDDCGAGKPSQRNSRGQSHHRRRSRSSSRGGKRKQRRSRSGSADRRRRSRSRSHGHYRQSHNRRHDSHAKEKSHHDYRSRHRDTHEASSKASSSNNVDSKHHSEKAANEEPVRYRYQSILLQEPHQSRLASKDSPESMEVDC